MTSVQFCTECGAANRPTNKFCAVCGHPLDMVASTGLLASTTILKQRYQIVRKIGQGGFGAVYQANDLHLRSASRAVKEMSEALLVPQERQEALAAFQQEAALLAGLMHPNLPRIYDHFEEQQRWYLVMDYIEGETLDLVLARSPQEKMPLEQVVAYALQLCTVLNYLHNHNPPIIFRDLKPSNVMVTPDEQLYLIDFGIARLFKTGQAKDTIALGSPGYAAPEQYGKAQTTVQADIYSLGATMHHLLSGCDPSDNPFTFPLLRLKPDGPQARTLAELVERMVAIDKGKRPASIQEVKQALLNLPPLSLAAISPGLPFANNVLSIPIDPDSYTNKGDALYDSQRYKDALDAYDQALRLDPEDANAYTNKGNALYHLNLYEEALEAYNQAIRLDPEDANAYTNKGDALYALQLYEAALIAYDQALQHDPGDAYTHIHKGNVLYALQRYDAALAAYDQVIRLDPGDSNAYTGKGDVFYDLERYEEALAAYDQAIRLNPDNARAYDDKGDTLYALQRYGEALLVYNQAIRLNPDDARAYSSKGDVFSVLHRYKEALTAYNQAIRLDSDDAYTYNNKGDVLMKLGLYQRAEQAYRQASKR